MELKKAVMKRKAESQFTEKMLRKQMRRRRDALAEHVSHLCINIIINYLSFYLKNKT